MFEILKHFFDKGLMDTHHSVRNAVIGSVKKMGEVNPKPVLNWAKFRNALSTVKKSPGVSFKNSSFFLQPANTSSIKKTVYANFFMIVRLIFFYKNQVLHKCVKKKYLIQK